MKTDQINDAGKNEGTAQDWPPQASATGRADGEQDRGSTGQLFEVKDGQWVRVPEEVAQNNESTDSKATGFAAIDQAAGPLEETTEAEKPADFVDEADLDLEATKPAEKKTVSIINHGDPVELRLEEPVKGEMGIVTYRQIGSISLDRGRNEVDAEDWKAWYDLSGKTHPLAVSGAIMLDEKKEEEANGEGSEQ